jgi:hypothetical protein
MNPCITVDFAGHAIFSLFKELNPMFVALCSFRWNDGCECSLLPFNCTIKCVDCILSNLI